MGAVPTNFDLINVFLTVGNIFFNIFLFYMYGKQAAKIECLNKIIDKYEKQLQ